MNELMAILTPALGEKLAKAVIDHKKAKPSGRRFDGYRARILLDSLLRSPEPNVAAWELLNRAENFGNPSQEYVKACVIYHECTGAFESRIARGNCEVGEMLGTITPTGYVVIGLAGKVILAHRLAWFYEHGVWPSILDHIDRIRVNNNLENLRECSNQENSWNLSPSGRNTSGFSGVTWDSSRGKWFASIRIDGKTKGLGRFHKKDDAAAAVKAAIDLHRGQFLGRAA